MRTLVLSSVLCCAAVAAAAQQAPRIPPPSFRARKPLPPPTGPAVGNVIRVDVPKRTIYVTGRTRTDRPQTVYADSRTLIVREMKGSADQLKPGDTIQVTGVPLVIDAHQVRYGAIATTPEVTRTKPAAPAPPGAPERPSHLSAAEPRLMGRVVKTAPLTVELRGGVTAELKVSGGTSFVKVAPIELKEIQPGDAIMALGKRDPQATLVARRIQVGVPVRAPSKTPPKPKPRKKPKAGG